MVIISIVLISLWLYGFLIFIHSETKDNVVVATLVDYWTISTPTIAHSPFAINSSSRKTVAVFELENSEEMNLRSDFAYLGDYLNKKGILTYRNGKLKNLYHMNKQRFSNS